MIRPLALARQLAAIPFHFVRHQWAHRCGNGAEYGNGVPEKHSFGLHPRQHLLFWMPPKGTREQQSVVVFYHGGGWRLGWPDQFPTVAAWFLKKGFPVFMPAYRLLPRYAYPAMREDLNLAVQKILELMVANGLGQKKLLIAGMSAGANLAAHLAFNRTELANMGLTANIFSGFLSFAGPLDLGQLPNVRPLRGFAGGPPESEAFGAANPITWLSGQEHLPTLIVHGTDDAIVPFSSSASFFKKYAGPKTLRAIHGGSHLDSLGFTLNDHETSNAVGKWLDAN